MATHATGKFHNKSFDEETTEELDGGAKLTHARMTQEFTGDIEGSGTWETLMCYRDDGTAAYVGLARIAGLLNGRSGRFVVVTTGGYDGTEAKTDWTVVEGSATKELAGLTGRGTSVAPHGPDGSFTLDYEMARTPEPAGKS